MAFETKLNLNSCKSKQISGDTLNLSGCTNIFGKFEVESGGTISILSNRGAGKVLTSDANGLATWQTNTIITPITGATNGLCKYNTQNICLGGLLTNVDTNLFLTGNSFNVYSNNVGIFLNDISGSCATIICGSGATICLNGCASISSKYGDVLNMRSGSTVFCSASGIGIEYDADYSGNYTPRSLVDKSYVTGLTSSLDERLDYLGVWSGLTNTKLDYLSVWSGTTQDVVSRAITGATNGICAYDAQNVCLGGVVTNGVDIGMSNSDFAITGPASWLILGNSSNKFAYLCASGTSLYLAEDCAILISSSGSLNFNETGITISSSSKGIQYLSCYHDTYVPRSLVDKEYVDNMVFTGTSSNGITGATNLGSGNGTIFTNVTNHKINLKTISGGTNITLTCNANYIGISSSGSVSSITSGCGMNFSTITTTGTITLGTPSQITNISTNFATGTTHSHEYDASSFVSGSGGILVDGNNQFYLDNTYVLNAALATLYTFTGVTANQSIGTLPSGQTLGMVYILNSGSSASFVNIGTTPTGNEITQYKPIEIQPSEEVSVTVNMRLSKTLNKVLYISSADWTNVNLTVQWANITYQNASISGGSSTTGGGGFLGIVSKTSTEPLNLKNNQWVKPASSGTCFNYTFNNFCDITDTPINVNLSLEDVYLRYHESGNYWSKESYNKPISSGYTWIGDSNNNVCEVCVINEWVATESAICHMGQKYAYDTHTVAKTDLSTCNIFQNYIFIQNINLKNVGVTEIMTIPTGKKVFLNRAKLIILNDASPTTFGVSIGNNASSYNNIFGAYAIDDVLTNETYDLPLDTLPGQAVAQSAGSTLYFNVVTGSTNVNNLCAHLLVEGFTY